MSTINNLEKLIQMATLEQMYVMLEKLRVNTLNNHKDFNVSDINLSNNNTSNNFDFESEVRYIKNEIQNMNSNIKINDNMTNELTIKMNDMFRIMNDKLQIKDDMIHKLTIRVNEIEEELDRIKNIDKDANSVCKQIKGQQSLKRYHGFSNDIHIQNNNKEKDDVNIKLEIEEKIQHKNKDPVLDDTIDFDKTQYIKQEIISTNQDITNVNSDMQDLNEDETDDEDNDDETNDDEDNDDEDNDDEDNDDEDNDDEDNEDTEEEVGTEDEAEYLENDEVNIKIKEDVQIILDEEEEQEDSVGTEEEEDTLGSNSVDIEIKKEFEQEQIDGEKGEEEEGEEEGEGEEGEEEVFEIEIDDITYFATDEENGILYEMTKDGDIGKKVGAIKDGEPIFN
jgi:hypothetical protein